MTSIINSQCFMAEERSATCGHLEVSGRTREDPKQGSELS